ncbi:hypothetical protein B0A48_05663 [Cryoendolithus antarcticus]|uniref:Uncharacterized protein n=1 Tax=Cryoendolithus antarcticus TaxID=1507870 RepID=A0A1V8TBJ6_9PEZI|nr:hypothetical protein B0A48_05663 [Cryoendolithus antarcticus]
MKLEEFLDHRQVKYSILSHCWSQDRTDREVTYDDFIAGTNLAGQGWRKIVNLCEISRERGLTWTWIDTCCIDKSSSAELTEAINSMWKWYSGAVECYVFLDDCDLTLPLPEVCVKPELNWATAQSYEIAEQRSEFKAEWQQSVSQAIYDKIQDFASCRWFGRGWTLQELLAPREVLFYNNRYSLLGTRSTLSPLVSHAAGVGALHLESYKYYKPSVAQRMAWAARRSTTREEDRAYCLFGLFDVNMPLLYGEGANAFRRLQEEIIHKFDDLSILAWGVSGSGDHDTELLPEDEPMRHARCILAASPSAFLGSEHIDGIKSSSSDFSRYSMTNRGLEVVTQRERMAPTEEGRVIDLRLSNSLILRLAHQDDLWYRTRLFSHSDSSADTSSSRANDNPWDLLRVAQRFRNAEWKSGSTAMYTLYMACQEHPDHSRYELEFRLEALNRRRKVADRPTFDLYVRMEHVKRRQELLDGSFDALLSVAGRSPPERLDRMIDMGAGYAYLTQRGRDVDDGLQDTDAGLKKLTLRLEALRR